MQDALLWCPFLPRALSPLLRRSLEVFDDKPGHARHPALRAGATVRQSSGRRAPFSQPVRPPRGRQSAHRSAHRPNHRRQRGGGALLRLFAIASGCHFLLSLHALIAFISLYVYELPTHHCPFCLLHREYNGIGYPFYLLLLTGTIAGLGIGLLHRYRAVPSLRTIIPAMQHRLALTALVADVAFLVLAMGSVVASNLRL